MEVGWGYNFWKWNANLISANLGTGLATSFVGPGSEDRITTMIFCFLVLFGDLGFGDG